MEENEEEKQRRLSEEVLWDPLQMLGYPWKQTCMVFDPPSLVISHSEDGEDDVGEHKVELNSQPEHMLLEMPNPLPPSELYAFPEPTAPQIPEAFFPKKRGRKKPPLEQQIENRVLQLERNRMSARESRKRKKQYVTGLEAEIRRLNHELMQCKTKLQNYELIEKQKNLRNLDSYLLMREYPQNSETKKSINSYRTEHMDSFVENLLMKYAKEAEERRCALDQLIKTELEILLSPPHKYLLWASENNSGLFSPEMLMSAFNRTSTNAGSNGWDKILEESKLSEEEANIVYSSKEFFRNSASHFKKLVRSLLQTHKKLQEELKEIDSHIQMNFLKNIRLPLLRTFLIFVEKMSSRIELSNSNLFKLDKQTFSTVIQ